MHPEAARIPLPVALLAKRRLGARAKLLYGQLQLTPGFHHPSGEFTFVSLAALLSCSLPTVRKSVRKLAAKEWLTVTQKTEFNGPQHFGPTKLFSAESAAQQRVRDLMKIGICITEGIRVVVVRAEDLSLEAMQHKVGKLLPLRRLEGHERLIAYLEFKSRSYRSTAAEDEWPS